ncbi:MAG: TIM barrel protein [Armatimonadota bacterium]|nr:TIM barrel protein [Armatimonadota bacterium]MDR7438376.1 TIM barrel protein [Armatimonadota bacterium]MDR7563358.1 TIM barrel protein [Armatimonadota bacterium]MDR7602420.1 TIM barrel protein [Armatimonadota bacterium]
MPLRDLRGQAVRRAGEELVRHLQSFVLEPKFSVGVWYLSPFASRFHEKYMPDRDIPARLDLVARLKDDGVVGVEAHYPAEVHEDNLDLWKAFIRDTGIRLVALAPGIFYDRDFEFGALSSPLPAARQKALQRTIRTLELCRELQTDVAILWPGIDGYENPFGQNFADLRARFLEGLAEAMDTVPGVRVAFEPKPYEPRGRILFGTTAEGLLLAHRVEGMLRHPENRRLLQEGHALVALNPEVGHMLMGYEDLAYAFSLVCEEGRLAHSHWNSQPLGNYDQDLPPGVVSPEQMEAALYVLKMHGYQEHFGIDLNPERMPPEVAIRNAMDAIRAAADRINHLDHEAIVWAMEHPDRARGWVEAYLIRMRALHPEKLPPLVPLPR